MNTDLWLAAMYISIYILDLDLDYTKWFRWYVGPYDIYVLLKRLQNPSNIGEFQSLQVKVQNKAIGAIMFMSSTSSIYQHSYLNYAFEVLGILFYIVHNRFGEIWEDLGHFLQ